MKLHFFTLKDIEDYRKIYPRSSVVKRAIEEAHPHTLEELDQAFFYRIVKGPLNVPDGIFESKIFGETGYPGLRLDFNFGLRLDVPEGNFRVRISDFDTEKVIFDEYVSGGRLLSVEKYFIRWHVEVFLDDEKIFEHTLSLEGQPVAVMSKFDTLGDTLSFVDYFNEFQRIHRCKLSVCVPEVLRELIARLCPAVEMIDEINFQTYATYYVFMVAAPYPDFPDDFRCMSMTRVGGIFFGIDYLPPKAKFKPTESPVTDEPYVCIGIQARNARKGWLYPRGWDIVVDYLKRLGYRVFCIDKNAEEKNDGFTICKPALAEDFTGDRPILERANMLYHAQFFIGLGSGLSWLAEAVNCPVVMICGFSQEWCEFYTPYRVMNRKVCHGCFTDPRVVFLSKESCPHHKNTPRELECQKKISPRMVINAIERLIVDKNLTPPALRLIPKRRIL